MNGTQVKKQKHILKISGRDIHNDMVLPSSEGGFFGARTIYGSIFIGDT